MKQKLFSIITIMLLFPVVVKADTITISCPSTAIINEEFSCDIYCDTVNGVSDLTSKIALTRNLTYVTFTNGEGLKGDTLSMEMNLYGAKVFTGKFKIGTLKLKGTILGSGTIVLKNTVLFNNGVEDHSLENKVISTSVKINKAKTVVEDTQVTTEDKPTNNQTGTTNQNGSGQKKNTQNYTNKNSNKTNNSKPVEEKKEEEVEEEYEIDFTKGAYLTGLEIEGYDIDFRSDIFEYDLKIKDEKELKITPKVGSEDVTYKVLNNKDLEDGSIITIEVIYKDDEIKNYYINISKEKEEKTEKNKKSNFIIIFIVIVVLLVLINVARMFIKKGKNDEDSE